MAANDWLNQDERQAQFGALPQTDGLKDGRRRSATRTSFSRPDARRDILRLWLVDDETNSPKKPS